MSINRYKACRYEECEEWITLEESKRYKIPLCLSYICKHCCNGSMFKAKEDGGKERE